MGHGSLLGTKVYKNGRRFKLRRCVSSAFPGWLTVFATAAALMSATAVRCRALGSAACCVGARSAAIRRPGIVVELCTTALRRAVVAAVGSATGSAVVTASAFAAEAVSAPTVAIAPSTPWAHAQEDAVVKVSRPVKSHRCAGIRRVAVVAIRTNRLNANSDINLRLGR